MNLNIRQEDIKTGILENYPDQMGNKIRLREISYANSLRHVASIPFNSLSKFEIIEPIDSLLMGKSKPINVKENMFNNVIKNSGYKLENKILATSSVSENSKTKQEEIPNEVSSAISQDSSVLQNDSNTSSFSADPFNGESVEFADIANVRNIIINAKMEAEKAEASAIESDEQLSKVSVEETEVEKRLQDAIIRQKEIRNQISIALENQRTTLIEARKRYDTMILDANRRKEENQNKIVEFQSRIDGTKKQISEIENDISEQQNILNALKELENYSSNDNSQQFDISNGVGSKVA